ncbi:MAG TPA: hypothetical protein VFE32_17215 [Puia sp.]|jgi:hypothetical protein|nr:hypothetical protein [Puia sp.]
MSRIDNVVERCITHARQTTVPEELTRRRVREEITWFVEDALKLARNINETSVGPRDRLERLIEMEQRTGISKSPLL